MIFSPPTAFSDEGDRQFKRHVKATGLSRLNTQDLVRFVGSFCGDASAFKHVLPRICELDRLHDSYYLIQKYKIPMWPVEEITSLVSYLLETWERESMDSQEQHDSASAKLAIALRERGLLPWISSRLTESSAGSEELGFALLLRKRLQNLKRAVKISFCSKTSISYLQLHPMLLFSIGAKGFVKMNCR